MKKPHVRNELRKDKRMKVLKNKDIKRLREKWLKKQDGKDAAYPLLNIEIAALDHDHASGLCRGVLDRDVNQFIGKIESNWKRFVKHKVTDLPNLLRGIANYLENNMEVEEILHPKSVSDKVRKFSRLNTKEQDDILIDMGVQSASLNIKKADKTKLYRKLLTKEDNVLKF